MREIYLMKCGHVSNAQLVKENGERIPSCVICACSEIEKKCEGKEGLEGRKAICSQHKYTVNKPVDSHWGLPFFEYRPDKDYDLYYCGCWGWD